MTRHRYLVIVLTLSVLAGSVSPWANAQPSSVEMDWLGWLNHYRGLANLPPVTEDPTLNENARLHARYMKMTGTFGHEEDPSSPWYTPGGDAAGRSGLLGRDDLSHRKFIEDYASMMIHGINLLDPHVTRAGFGVYENYSTLTLPHDDGWWEQEPVLPSPITWPADGKSVGLSTLVDEADQSTTTCPVEGGVNGLPIKLHYEATPNITSTSLSTEGRALGHCVYDETTYDHADPAAEELSRGILEHTHSVVLIPDAALVAGETYTVSVSNGSQTTTWSFSVVAPQTVVAPDQPGATPSPSPTTSPSTDPSPDPSPTPEPSPTSTDGYVASGIEMTVVSGARRLSVNGVLSPERPGQIIRLALSRARNGTFSVVARKAVTIDGAGYFQVRLLRVPGKRCKVVARYRGDEQTSPAKAVSTGPC